MFCQTSPFFHLLKFLQYLPQVHWDESSSHHRPERVSPWETEVSLDPVPVSRTKRHRLNVASSPSGSSMLSKEGTFSLPDGDTKLLLCPLLQ